MQLSGASLVWGSWAFDELEGAQSALIGTSALVVSAGLLLGARASLGLALLSAALAPLLLGLNLHGFGEDSGLRRLLFSHAIVNVAIALLMGRYIATADEVFARARAETERLDRSLAETRQLQQQQILSQRMQAVGQLAGGVAHEFNNLLAAFGGASGLMRGVDDPELAQLGEDLAVLRDRGARLTHSLLTFARQDDREVAVVELAQILGELEPVFQRMLTERYQVVLQASTPVHVFLDRGQLEQALLNLVVNARDAMPEGGTLTLTVRGEAGRALIEVTDTGIGMPADVQERAFEPFFTTKVRGEGTGLGLAQVHGAVTGSGGEVSLHSEPGGGTTFTLSWPSVESSSETLREAAARPKPVPPPDLRVLVVDDDPQIRRVVRRLLTREGFQVVEAESGEAALALDPQVDVVLSDVLMPGISGPELLLALRERHPGLPAVLFSGYTGDEFDRRRLADVPWVRKPFRPHELVARLLEVTSVA